MLWDLLFRSRIRVRSDLLNTIKRYNHHLYLLCSSPFDVGSLNLDFDWLVDLDDHGNGPFVLGVSSRGDDDSVQHGFLSFLFVDFL